MLGLSLGISVGIVLFLYLQHELSYDQHFPKHKEIYRYTAHMKAQGADFNTATSSRRMAPILKTDLPEVIDFVRFLSAGQPMVSRELNGEVRQFYEDQVFHTDSTIFNVFDHKIIEGNPATCLAGPSKVVLTKSTAEKYFGTESAVGKLLKFNNNETREVTAIISDLPDNTHLQYDVLLSDIPRITYDDNGEAERTSEIFWNPSCYTYLLMPKSYDAQSFYDKFPDIYDKTYKTFALRIEGSVEPDLQRLDEIHFAEGKDGDQPTGNMSYVIAFAIVGIFIILLACINYMNLTTAQSVNRTNEIGIRKVLGKTKLGLFSNVMIEAITMAVIAMVLANLLTLILLELTSFNSLINKDLSINYFSNYWLIFAVLSITFLIGLVSGIYPALYIPSVPVAVALKGTFTSDQAGSLMRKGLITFQFVISLFVLICTVLMDRQIKYMTQMDMGFDTENTVLINVQDSTTEARIPVIKEELMKNPNIIGATNSYGVPGRGLNGPVMMIEKDSGMVQQFVHTLYAGRGYLDLMNIEMVDGRTFREESENDYMKSYLVNESGAKEFGWGKEAIGKKIKYFHGEEEFRIIGVFKDFNFESLHNPITPMFITLDSDLGGTFYVKIKSGDLSETLQYIEDVWTRFDTKHPFDYTFIDQEFAEQYKSDQIQQQLISVLSYISIFVSMLGLIGLSAFTASRKAKEISIRRILGANITGIILLFSREFIQLMIVAVVIAIPLADYAIVEWMSGFAYTMSISWLYFALPALLVLAVGLLTVVIQSFNAAKNNPVLGLRKD